MQPQSIHRNDSLREYSLVDKSIMLADNALKTLFGGYQTTSRANPAASITAVENAAELSKQQQQQAAALMRINHCGEVCAQALYQGQALTAKLPHVREKMQQAAIEENDHLNWCSERLKQLESRPSLLNPLFYLGSFSIGAIAGAIGDQWSLGFVAETEHQVVKHLDSHLQKLPQADQQSRAILIQMRSDELQHATTAVAAGAAELPAPVKTMMTWMSKLMTSSVYYI